MNPLLPSSFQFGLLLLAVSLAKLIMEPEYGSIGGGTWITLTLDGLSVNVSRMQVALVNPALPTIPCDMEPLSLHPSIVKCQTRSAQLEGLYHPQFILNGQIAHASGQLHCDNCTFQFSTQHTPVVYRIDPPCGVPGNVIQVYGRILASKYDTYDFNVDFIDGPLILNADGWITLCSLADRQTHSIYSIQTSHGLGTLGCRVEGNYIGSHNVSFSVFNKGKSLVHKDAWLISAKQELFLYQTFPEIFSVFPVGGSLGGGTRLTISGDFFDTPVTVTVAGTPCPVKYVSPQRIICTTGAAGKNRCPNGPQPEFLTIPRATRKRKRWLEESLEILRGLLLEVWEGTDTSLGAAAPAYRWQFVPNASLPLGFLPGGKQLFSARLRGFFVAPQTNNYTFWIQADAEAALYLSLSEDPGKKVEIASLPDQIPGRWTNCEENWSPPWNPKSEKFELTGGCTYYLEAVYRGRSPSSGMKIGVQMHNTWLNPDVVNTYRRESHKILASVSRLPEIQMLTFSGTGEFSLVWDNATSIFMSTNATAGQVQKALEDLLSIKCETEPSSANILLQAGFEHGTEKFTSGGCAASWTEPFCGRFSAHKLESLVKIQPFALAYDVTKYTHLCFAHKGHLSNTLYIAVSYTDTFLHIVKKNLACQWPLNETSPESWKFVCTDLWRDCLENSESLKDLLKNSSVFLHQIDIEPLASVAESSVGFFVDEIIVADTDIVVFQREARPPHPHGRLIESVSVVGAPPVYNVSFLAADCCEELPLLSLRGAVSEASVNLTVWRVQMASPPLGGTFRIHLPNVVISGVPVSISAERLRKLLQSYADNFTAQYLNASDFLVTKDSSSCYQSKWMLTWVSKTGDLPNFIRVSAENLTGLNPVVMARVVFDGGVFISPIFGDMLATPNDCTQVVVAVNDVPANCSGSCIFQYLLESTPIVSSVKYSVEDAMHMLIHLAGCGFTADRRSLLVEVNQMDCEVLASNRSSALCQMNLLPAGLYRVALLVRPYGFAVNASGEGVFLRIMPRLSAVEPPMASEIGGLPVTLTGSGFDGISLVAFGSQPCPINASASNTTVIECRLPPWRGEDHVVDVMLASEHESALFPSAFTYDASRNPFIISLSRNTSSVAGGQALFIGLSSFANYTQLDVKVLIQETAVEIQAQTPNGLRVMLPSLTRGRYNLSVFLNDIPLAAKGVELFIRYVTEVFRMEPCCGSLLGGTLLTISGTGFGNNQRMVSIFVGSQPCPVSYLNEEKIVCHIPPAAQLPSATVQDLSANVQLFIGNRSSADTPVSSITNFTFLYRRSLTPSIVDVEVEMANDTLGLKIEVVNMTDLVALLGDVECDLKMEHANHSTVSTQCSVPLNVFEPGQYPIRLLQKQMGYANISTARQHFMVAPLIKAIFPSHGSVCGGQLVMISGRNLKSRTNSSHVNLTGNFTCEIQSSDDTIIRCALSRRDLPMDNEQFWDGSQNLGVTVTINGLDSHCLEDCSFHLLENLTFIIDAVTVQFSERLIHLLIRAQGSVWEMEETSIEVDSYLACNITFWNETSVECQLNSLVAGDHVVSIKHRRWGQACLHRKGSDIFRVDPRVFQFYPQNFSTNGGGLLTLEGIALKGRDKTSVLIGNRHCFRTDTSFWAVQCLVPPGDGIISVRLCVDDILCFVGEINYSEDSTPVFLSLLPAASQFLTIRVSRIKQAEDTYVFVGGVACSNVTGNNRTLHCAVPRLPAGVYSVTGGDVLRGAASSSLLFTSLLTVTSVNSEPACLDGGKVHLRGTGFSPGNTSVTICGTLCEILDGVTTTDLTCLAQPLNASLAVLCGLTWSFEEKSDCPAPVPSLIQCDIHVMANTSVIKAATPYLYFCNDSVCSYGQVAVDSSCGFFSGMFISPKVERDEVLIYNTSCNITMETEAEMECEGPNQPITAKITEIWKKRDQNTQSAFPLRFCGYWSKHWSWLSGGPPHDGDNVTVERGQTLLLDTSTSILRLLHVKGGKLVFVGPGPVELHAHYILVSDGGELRVGSPGEPLCGIARIHLHGSSHTPLFDPYGAKFLAVRNGTLSMHGCVPQVTVTHLKSGARPNDTKLSLMESVDWKPGDEVVVCGGGLRDAQKQEEVVTVKSVNGTDLYITSPLRYLHDVSEEPVLGERLHLRAVVASLSRSVVIRGNVTSEKISHWKQCKKGGVSGGKRDGSKCLYTTSERKLGSRDMGAVVIVQSYPGEESQLHLEGVQFRHVGQAFRKYLSALTIAGSADMTNSYIRDCVVLDSFARGISFTGVSHLRIENNILYNIMGHGIHVGERLDQKNQLKHNTIIGLSGTDGLSNIETFSPAGIYIQAPDNWIEDSTVCAAGHGYFFHLSPTGPSQVPILSFSRNVAHSCIRYGLLLYPEYHPQRANSTIPVVFQSFTAWQCLGGVQIMSSSNLQLQAFLICVCRDFGADIVESLGNTSVADSLFLGRLRETNGSCMFTGLKTPKRRELLISNATFVNFDILSCTAIAPCSSCQQGQGGFTVKAEQVLLLNSPNWISFPTPHSAILEDLDGSITGQEGSLLLPYMDILPTSCRASVNISQTTRGSICAGSYVFHRMSIGLKASVRPYDLKVTDSHNKTMAINYVPDTLSNVYGWMAILVDQETYTLSFDNPLANVNLQYVATFDNFTAGNYLLVEHEGLSPHINITVTCGTRPGSPLQSLPSHRYNKSCDWAFSQEQRKLTYLVTGEGLIQVTFKAEDAISLPVPDPVPPPPPPPPSSLRWSLSASWDGVPESWGGYNNSIPLPGDDVIILPGKTILVDMILPRLRGLYILGALEFPSNSSNVLSASCMLIAGGALRVGTLQKPLERRATLQIVLRASEKVYCDRLDGIGVPPGTLGVYGKLQMHSVYPRISWTHLGYDVAPGNERFWVQDPLDWHRGDSIVISPSSYEAHQAEVATLEEVSGHSIRICERLLYRHLGYSHTLEGGQTIPLAAEIGLLTRNIQIKTDSHCTGRLLVGSFRNASGTEYTGVLQLSNVEILNFGSSQFPAVDVTSATSESFIISSSIHQSCGVGLRAMASSGLLLQDNVVFSTAGHGIHLGGRDHSLIRNLVILSKQPEGASYWVAGIKTNGADNAHLRNNVVAGSERIAFHIRGQECFLAGELCSGNVAHSSLHGVHLYTRDGFSNCTKIAGFLSYKNYDYGVIFHLEGNVVVENVILVDNNVGLLPVLFCPSSEQRCHLEKQYIELRNSVLLATSSSFDCIKDRIHPLSAHLTMRDRAPRSPWRGRVGILWPSFTSEPSCWPDRPWHKIRNYSAVLGIMKLQDVTFAGFRKTCYSDDRDICIMTSPDNTGILHVVTSERTRMLHVNEQNMFHFYPSQTGKNESGVDSCVDGMCDGSRKALFKDLDGSTLGLDPPVSVFPKSKSEWEQPCLDSGIYREDRKCVYKASANGYFCKETSHAMVILESIGTSASHRKSPPPVLVTGTFVDIFSDGISSPHTSKHSSFFYSILSSKKLSKVCFASAVPRSLKLYVNSGHNATRILLAIFYDEPRSFRVFAKGKYISPALLSSISSWGNAVTGTNYFNFQENLLYVVICQEDSIEIDTQHSIHIAFTVADTVGAEFQALRIAHLADFLQIGHSQIRTVHDSSGSENTLKIIADNAAKRKHQCSTMKSCMFTHHRAGQQRKIIGSTGNSQWSLLGTGLRVLILEISDPPSFPSDNLVSSFSSERLNSLANILINAQQVGELERVLQLPVDSLVVTVFPTSTPPEGNSSLPLKFRCKRTATSATECPGRNESGETQRTCLYVRPYNLSLLIQPSDGVVGRPLPRQPQVVFLDKQGQRVVMLGFSSSKSWIVTALLQGDPNVVLKGTTKEEVHHGRATFQNLMVSSSCLNCYLIFKVTSPPGAVLSVTSNFFTIRPVTVTEKSAIIFTTALGAAASAVVLGSVVLCWFKKRKRNRKTLSKRTSKDKKFSPIEMNHPTFHTNSRCFGEANKHGSAAKREDVKIHERAENTVEQLKKMHQQTLSNTSSRRMNCVKSGCRSRGGKPARSSLELHQLGIKDLSEQKGTNQLIFDCAQWKEMKERQLADEGHKRHSEKPASRPRRGTRGKQEVIVA